MMHATGHNFPCAAEKIFSLVWGATISSGILRSLTEITLNSGILRKKIGDYAPGGSG